MSKKLEIGQRVELLPGREDVYDRVYPATPGVVSGTRTDEYGYDQVFIIWDKDHWRYNGEDDLWTFASHFKPLEGKEKELIGTEIHEAPSSPPQEEWDEPTDAELMQMESYLDALENAAGNAAEADAFFFVCLKKDEQGRDSVRLLYGIGDPRLKDISIADVFAFAEREMRRKGR